MTIIFYIAAAVAVVSTVLTITRTNAVHALLYFICSLLATGVMFFALGAPFVAMLVVIINAGAIMVLFVFVITMLNLGPQSTGGERLQLRLRAWLGPALLSGLLTAELVYGLAVYPGGTTPGQVVTAEQVGVTLFGPYLLGVELASVLLLAGLLGAYHLGHGAVKPAERKP
jgi:NADH-quinone oxidoreductase subunit J